MNNKKKVAFQQHRITELEKQVHNLIAENKTMMHKLEYSKKMLAEKEDKLVRLQSAVDEIQSAYSDNVNQTHELQNRLRETIAMANASKEMHYKEFVALIKRIKNGK